MAHQPKKDPFAPIVLLIGLVILGATVFVLLSNLYTTVVRNSTKGIEDNSREMAIADASLKPIGSVTAIDKSVEKAPRKGDEIYKAVCTSCHGTGILESPKFGDKDQWAPRVANGLASLMKTATEGRGAMPPKGGDPTLSDEELKAVVLYMTKEAGFDLSKADADTKTETAPAAKTEETPAEKPTAPSQPEPVAKPAQPATPSTPAEPSAPASPEEAAVAPAPVVTEKAEVVPAPVAAEKPEVAPAPVVTEKTEVAPVEAKKVAAAPKVDGEAVYKASCFACHATGVAGSPLFGNKALWAPRIATGMDALYNSSLKGKGAMPPKGGNFSLSDDAVKAAVDYMVSNAK